MFVPVESLFKAYDIRGVVDRELSEAATRSIGQAVGSAARDHGDHSVIVGRDGRLSGPRLRDALVEGINASGCDVIDIGVTPTPVVYFATHHLGIGSSVAITGSHNPPEYNGLKIMVGGSAIAGDEILSLRKRIESDDLRYGQGNATSCDVIPAYIQRVTDDVRLHRPFHLVVDCGNGVAGAVAPALFRQLGCQVDELYCEVDGSFPNHHPDPIQPENLEDLIAEVQKTGADFGIAFDGDGDRLGVVSPSAAIIWPDRQMILLSEDLLKRRPGAEIIYDVKCTRLLPQAIERAGGKATMWKTGHSLIKSKLRESGAALAGEMSGHIFFSERWYGFDDGLYSGARLCELLSADSRTPEAVFADIPNALNTPELRLECPEENHHQLVADAIAAASFDDADVSLIDGLRVDFSNGFALVRASNTTPTVIIRFEADDEAGMADIQDRVRHLLHSVRPGMPLPF